MRYELVPKTLRASVYVTFSPALNASWLRDQAKLSRDGDHSGHFEEILAKADVDIDGYVDGVFERLSSKGMDTQELRDVIQAKAPSS